MSKHKPAPPSDYATGYRRPPKETQFKPGQSGNPKGRPKGSLSDAAIHNKIFEEKVTVTENGKKRLISKRECIARRRINDAMRGDAKAMKITLDLSDRYSDLSAKPGNSRGADPDRRTVIVVPHNGRDALPDS